MAPEKLAALREKEKLANRAICATPEGRAKDREIHKRSHLKKKYGISLELFEHMLDKQHGKCAVCDTNFTFVSETAAFKKSACSVDHDHKTGKIRALLCNSCNAGMGYFKDDPALLRKAAAYLESYQIKRTPITEEATCPV